MASAKKLDLVLINPSSRSHVYQSLGKTAGDQYDETGAHKGDGKKK